MPVELSIVETVTELETTIVEVVLDSSSAPGIPGPGVPAGGTANQVLTKDSSTDYDTSWQDAQGGGGGAPTTVDYLVGTASGSLSAEIVVGTSPGGELGGTWASPTVDATHSGSSHASVQAAAEATAAAALATHEADTTGVHGIADTSALALTANHPTNATFNDHSARHENGGADEISIAGLDGISTELAAHLADTSDAHDASAISIADAGNDFTATDVEGALAELQSDHEADAQGLADHIADSSAAHAASAISVSSTTLSGTGTDVQAVFEEIDNLLDDHSARHEDGGADEISIQGLAGTPVELTNHLSDTSDAHDASAISSVAAGGLSATDVQAALNELDSEKATPAQVATEIADQRRAMVVIVSAQDGTAITTGDGKAYIGIPNLINGHNLVAANIQLVGVSSSGSVTVQVHNVTQAADMLTTPPSIQVGESHSKDGTPGVVDTGNDDVAYGDLLRFDIDAAGTGADGLIAVLEFEAP